MSLGEKNVGTMETWLIRGIGMIIMLYLGGDTIDRWVLGNGGVALPAGVIWLLTIFIVGYFVNRVWIKIEHYIDNWILIKRLMAEAERQVMLSKIQEADSDDPRKDIPVVDHPEPEVI